MNIELDVNKDQNILIDKEVIDKEIDAAMLKKSDKVLEIGAGYGNLTEDIAKKGCNVAAYEIDERFREKLEELTEKYKNLSVVFANALDVCWNGYTKIVSNIPYSVSEAVINKIADSDIKLAVLIVSEGFKELLFIEESKIGMIARLFFGIEEIEKVEREKFRPVPGCDSFVVRLKRRKAKNAGERVLRNAVFSKKRVKNALVSALMNEKKTKREAKEIVNKLGIDENVLSKPAKRMTARFMIRLSEILRKIWKN